MDNSGLQIPLYSAFDGAFAKPTDILDPNKKKGPEYALSFCKFIYSQFYNNYSAIKSNMARRFVRNRSYAVGNQDTSIYKNWIFGSKNDQPQIPIVDPTTQTLVNQFKLEDMGLENINFDDIFSPLPKYVDNIIGILHGVNHNIVVNATDENSGAEREEMKFSAYVREELNKYGWLTKFNASMGIPEPQSPPVQPASRQELELFDNIGAFKLPAEIAMENVAVHTINISQLDDETKDELIYSGLTDGFQCLVTEQDVNTGKFVTQRKDVLEIILEDSKYPDFRDSTWGGYIEWYTIHKLAIETGKPESELQSLAGSVSGEYGNPEQVDVSVENGAYKFGNFRVPVLHCFWKSIDTEYYSKRTTSVGTKQFYEPYTNNGTMPPKQKKNKNITKSSIRRLYHAKWVIGNDDIVFDHGIVTNTPYNFGTKDVEFPIQLYRLPGKPKIEGMIPIADRIHLTWLRTQNEIANARPSGYTIEWSSLQNLRYGNKKIDALDAFKLFDKAGRLVWSMQPKGIPGQQNAGQMAGPPIQELNGGLANAIMSGFEAFQALYRELDAISGLDSLTMANVAPNADTRSSVAQLASTATTNSLKSIYNGYLSLKKNSIRVVLWMVEAMMNAYTIKDLNENPYFSVIGRSGLTALLTASKYPPACYGLSVEAATSEFEKQQFLGAAQAALQGGKNGVPSITFSEYTFLIRYIDSKKSIKFLQLWMAKKEQERALEAQKIAQENSQIQAQKEQETATIKAQQEIELENLKTQNKLKVLQLEAEENRKTIALEMQLGETFKRPNLNPNGY